MDKNPLVVAAIPAFNEEKTIARTVVCGASFVGSHLAYALMNQGIGRENLKVY